MQSMFSFQNQSTFEFSFRKTWIQTRQRKIKLLTFTTYTELLCIMEKEQSSDITFHTLNLNKMNGLSAMTLKLQKLKLMKFSKTKHTFFSINWEKNKMEKQLQKDLKKVSSIIQHHLKSMSMEKAILHLKSHLKVFSELQISNFLKIWRVINRQKKLWS